MTPVSSHARAVMLKGPGWTSTVSDHGRHDNLLGAGCRSACRQVRPSSGEGSVRTPVGQAERRIGDHDVELPQRAVGLRNFCSRRVSPRLISES